MKYILFSCFFVIAYCNINAGKKSDEFELEMVNYLKGKYILVDQKKISLNSRDSLRSDIFFSQSLEKGNLYIFELPEANTSKHIFLTVYYYGDGDTSSAKLNRLREEKNRRYEEGFYGPIGKDFQSFVSASQLLIHFEAKCEDILLEKQWKNIHDSIVKFTRDYFKKEPKTLFKVCQ